MNEIRRGDRVFRVADHPSSADGRAAFLGSAEAATLGFFDATLPRCARMIDVGAYVGFMSLYAALQVAEVHAVEACPAHQALLLDNLALNPTLASRIALHRVAVGATEGEVTLYRKGSADSGTSVFETVERSGLVRGEADATAPMRETGRLLGEMGLDRATLLKIDVEGAEYAILPSLGEMLGEHLPFLQISFHPFNLVGADPYRTALIRLQAGLGAADALAAYPFIYLPHRRWDGALRWRCIDHHNRLEFLQTYLLATKPVPRVTSPQHGFVDAIGFSAIRLPELECELA
jgi:FkbM family methyltransferase